MASGNRRFGFQEIIAVAVLAGVATVLLESEMAKVAVRLSPALRQALAQWWPLLLILLGTLFLLTHDRSEKQSRCKRLAPGGTTHESRS